jgi:hypothetical protein
VRCPRGQLQALGPSTNASDGIALVAYQQQPQATWVSPGATFQPSGFSVTTFAALPSAGGGTAPFVTANGNGGRLQVVGLAADTGLPYLPYWQDVDGSWHTGGGLGGPGRLATVLAANGNAGYLQLVGLYQGAPWLVNWQDSNGNWHGSTWQISSAPPPGITYTALAAAPGANATLQLVGLASGGFVTRAGYQDSNGGWHDEYAAPLLDYAPNQGPSQAIYAAVAIGNGNSNYLQVVGLGLSDGQPYLAGWQDGNGNWNYGFDLEGPPGSPTLSTLSLVHASNDWLFAISLGADRMPYVAAVQDPEGGWHAGYALPSPSSGGFSSLYAVAGPAGYEVEVLGIGASDGSTYLVTYFDGSAWQSGWSI